MQQKWTYFKIIVNNIKEINLKSVTKNDFKIIVNK